MAEQLQELLPLAYPASSPQGSARADPSSENHRPLPEG